MKNDKLPITRRVLFEKTINNKLIILTKPSKDKRVKYPLKSKLRQYEEGRRLAMKLGLEYELFTDSNPQNESENILSRSQCLILKMILEKKVRFIYVRDVKMLSEMHWMRKYVIHFYAINNIVLFTKAGLYSFEHLQMDSKIQDAVDILTEEINELVPNISF